MEKTRIRAEAPPVFVINALNAVDVRILKPVQEKGNRLVFTIDKREKEIAFKTMDKKNVKYSVLSERGWKTDGKRLLMRFGMWAGIIVGLALIVIYSTMLTRIRVLGAERVNENDIIAATGISLPVVFASPDMEAIEKATVALDGIAGASVVRKGTTLEISVIEELPHTEIIDTETPAPLVANEDCVIERMVVVQGTAAVKKGDTVRKGDILIDAFMIDAEGNQVPVRAMGEVVANVFYQRHIFYPHIMMSKVRTGAKETQTVIELPSLLYKKQSSFVSYDTETRVIICSNILPFKIIKTTYYETREQETYFDFKTHQEQLVLENFEVLSSTLPEDGKPVKWWYLVKRLDKNTVLSIYYQIETQVAVRPR